MQKLKTRKSNPDKPPRVLIHGFEGVGKSTFAAKADSIFISPEGGCDHLQNSRNEPVDEVGFKVNDWADLHKALDQLLEMDHGFKYVCLDSADWVEKLCHKKIIGTTGKNINTVNGGYGAGFRKAESLHFELISKLSKLREERNMGIIITAHSHVKEVKDPSMPEDYDSFEVKCHEFVSSLWREWCECVLFVRFTTFVNGSETGGTRKARAYSDETRTCYCIKQPAFQAKNRYGMPLELPFTEDFWNVFMKYKNGGRKPLTKAQLIESINEFAGRVKDKSTLEKIAKSVLKAGENLTMLADILNRVKNIIKNQ